MSINLRLSYLQKSGGCLYRPSPHPKKWGDASPHPPPPRIYASGYGHGFSGPENLAPTAHEVNEI